MEPWETLHVMFVISDVIEIHMLRKHDYKMYFPPISTISFVFFQNAIWLRDFIFKNNDCWEFLCIVNIFRTNESFFKRASDQNVTVFMTDT